MEQIKRYLVKINKYVVGADSSEMISLGHHTMETEGGSICHLPPMGAFKSDSKFCFTLEVLEERIYKQSTSTRGMLELVDTIVLKEGNTMNNKELTELKKEFEKIWINEHGYANFCCESFKHGHEDDMERVWNFFLPHLKSNDEIKREAEPVLCFVEGDTAYFTTQPLNKQWGDDWNDAPYEHNAGTPYEDHSEERWNIYTLKFDWDAEQPKGEHYSSPYSVEDINGGKVPWLKPSKWIKDGKNIYAGATMRDFAISIMSTGGNVYRRLYEGDYLYPTKGKQ